MAGEKPKTQRLEDLLEAKVFKGKNGKTLPYRLLAPEKLEEGKQYPLIIFLHGAGERGSDNLAPLVHCVKDFTPAKVRTKYPCYLVVPQCPINDGWIKQSLWGLPKHTMEEKPGPSLALVQEMIPKLTKDLPGVDDKRVYIAGLSMGGYGTWELLQRAPNLFAAGIPICGGGDEAQANQIAKVPVWAFHGEKDNIVKPARTTDMVDAVKKAGGNIKLTMYKGVGHDSWTRVFRDPEVMEWLFAQKKDK